MLLDAVVDYLPSPLDVPPMHGINAHTGHDEVRRPDDSEPFAAFASRSCPIRSWASSLTSGCTPARSRPESYVYNSSKKKKERVGRILQMHANHREDITQAFSGDIAAAVGLKGTTTGDTLCDASGAIILESIDFPNRSSGWLSSQRPRPTRTGSLTA